MGMNAEQIAQALGSKKKDRQGNWSCKCPAHDDQEPSLSLRDSGDKVVFHCHAGCSQTEVMDALIVRGLFSPPGPKRERPLAPRGTGKGLGKIEAVYPYADENGEVLHETVRFEGKKFRQRRPARPGEDATNGVVWSIKDAERVVIYRLPQMVEALKQNPERTVFIVEGEKDADNLAALDVVATCHPMGAGNWRPEYAEFFKGRNVVVLPDNDPAGEALLLDILESVKPVAASITFIRLPDLPAKGDVSDWIAAGGTRKALAKLVTEARAKPPVWPSRAPAEAPKADDDDTGIWVQPVKRINGHNHDEPAWEEPIDIFTKPPLPRLKGSYLPAAIAPFIVDQSTLVGSDPGILAISCLVSCAACIDDAIKIQPREKDYTWTESARLWGAFVGGPSVRKTPAAKRAINHLFTIDREIHARSEGEQARYDEEAQAAKKEKRGMERDRPGTKRLVVMENTVEKLGEMLEHNPRGMLGWYDELAGWFGNMDAYRGGKGSSSKDRPLWLEAYNGGPKMIDRITRGSSFVPNWSMCVLGGIQPETLYNIAKNLPEDGLFQRFMVVIASRYTGAPEDRSPDVEAMNGWRELLNGLFAIQPSSANVKLSPEAQDIRRAFDADMDVLTSAEMIPTKMQSAIAKWTGLFARLLLVYHCIESVGRKKHPTEHLVTRETAEAVDAFLRQYLMGHTHAFYTECLGGEGVTTHARKIASMILAKGYKALANRDITAGYFPWRDMPQWTRQRVTQALEDAGWLAPADGPYQKGRTTHWHVNPAVHTDFEEHGKVEKSRRAEDAAKLSAMKNIYSISQQSE